VSASALICPFTNQTWGHLTRCFALADALVALGVRVRFACPPAARRRVEGAGFEFAPLAAMDRQVLLFPPRSARAGATARRWIAGELAAARACIHTLAPDIVVTDLQPLVNVAAGLAAVPSASVQNLELLASPLAWWLPGLERLLGELAIPRWAAGRVFGDTLVVADTPSVTGLRDLPASLAARIVASVRDIRFVGPILGDLPRRRQVTGRPRPEVIVSLGGGPSAGAEDVVAGCAAVDADLVVITPAPSDALARTAGERRRTGRKVTIVDFLPDFAARIAQADALITHGGHGTLTLALALAVPTLVVPTTVERKINARRLHGIGAVTSSNPDAIRATIGGQLAALLRDRAGDPARARLAGSLARYDGAREAARLVQRMAQARLTEGAW
jgi:UDP:flavonoid glycosyltransferase YjiC (YdhE family)